MLIILVCFRSGNILYISGTGGKSALVLKVMMYSVTYFYYLHIIYNFQINIEML